MKASPKQFWSLLALIALLATGNLRAIAHDLPTGWLTEQALTTDCFFSAPRLAVDMSSELALKSLGNSIPLTSSMTLLRCYPSFLSAIRPTAAIEKVLSRFEPISAEPTVVSHSLPVARPADGRAPRPRQALVAPKARQLLGRTFLEGYMPYDFSVSDWRFGQLSGNVEPVIVEIERPVSVPQIFPHEDFRSDSPVLEPTAESIVLGAVLDRIEQMQCQVCNALHDGHVLATWSPAVNQRQKWILSAWNRCIQLGVSSIDWDIPNAPAELPLFREPQFVVYEFAQGKRIALTIAQARSWHFVRETPSRVVSKFIERSVTPARDELISALSRQLESVGNGLLAASKYLEGLADSRTASRARQEIR